MKGGGLIECVKKKRGLEGDEVVNTAERDGGGGKEKSGQLEA